MARAHLSLKTKLASALLQLRDAQGDLFIDFEHAKLMSADQIISLYQFDHYPLRHEAGGPDLPWNLVPTPIIEHRAKTATIDVPEVAKIKRVTRKQEEFRQRLLAKAEGAVVLKPKWPSRPFRRKVT